MSMGRVLIIVGIVIVLIGVLYTYFPQALSWFGNLPGDIKVEKPNTRIYFPITSMIVISVLLNLALRMFRYLN